MCQEGKNTIITVAVVPQHDPRGISLFNKLVHCTISTPGYPQVASLRALDASVLKDREKATTTEAAGGQPRQ